MKENFEYLIYQYFITNIHPKINISEAELYKLNLTTITAIIYSKNRLMFYYKLKIMFNALFVMDPHDFEKYWLLSYLNKHR